MTPLVQSMGDAQIFKLVMEWTYRVHTTVCTSPVVKMLLTDDV